MHQCVMHQGVEVVYERFEGVETLTKWLNCTTVHTLYNAILRIARIFLETRENIKISTHPFYHVNLGGFSYE